MFKKNQLNWNFSINTAMYSCVTMTAGANRTPMIERIAKIVNCLSRWLFSLGALSQIVDQFQLRHSIQHGVFCEAAWQFLALGCFLWEHVLLVLAVPLNLFIQRRYFTLATEGLIFFSLLLLRNVLITVILRFHGYQYQTFQILNFIVTGYYFTLKIISGERDRNISSQLF